MEQSFVLQKEDLYLPVSLGREGKYLEVFVGEEKVFEFLIPAGSEFDYTAKVCASHLKGKTLTLRGDFAPEFFASVMAEREILPMEEKRPDLHFTAAYGWINDPNGLIYDKGLYHLYFQHNPFDVKWQNMSWGHATSTDLLHWTRCDDVMFPDERGTIFSGCGLVVDDTYLFPYTVAGTSSPWSEGKPFYQGLATSKDGGFTLEKQEHPFLGITGKDSRDPKIFWHEESSAYVMVLYLEGNDFGIFRSKDLKHWEKSQHFTLPEAWECPDLLCVPAEDASGSPSKWMFWTADGFYYWGDFDGYQFVTDGKRHEAFLGKHYYATQTYWGVGNRILAMHWLRFEEAMGKHYQGAMGIPREYCYRKIDEDYQLVQLPAKEFRDSLRTEEQVPEEGCYVIDFSVRPMENYHFSVNGSNVTIDQENGWICVDHEKQKLPAIGADIQLIVDYNLMEIAWDNAIMGVFLVKGERNEFCMQRRAYGNTEGCGSGDWTDCHYSIKSIK